MGIAYNTSIVRDSLQCLIDPANIKCLTPTSSVAVDLTGNNFNGILRNPDGIQTSLSSMTGILEYDTTEGNTPCLNFIGLGGNNQGYLEFSSHPVGGFENYSLDAWFKIISLTPSAEYNVIFYSTLTVGQQEFGLMAQNSISDPDVAIEINNAYTAGTTNVRATLGWHYFSLTFNGTQSKLYIDGVNVYTRSDTNTIFPSTGWNWIGVGQWQNGNYSGTTGYTQGKLGYLSLYGKALSEHEIQQNFNALRGRYGI